MAPKAPGPQGYARMNFHESWVFEYSGRNKPYTDL